MCKVLLSIIFILYALAFSISAQETEDGCVYVKGARVCCNDSVLIWPVSDTLYIDKVVNFIQNRHSDFIFETEHGKWVRSSCIFPLYYYNSDSGIRVGDKVIATYIGYKTLTVLAITVVPYNEKTCDYSWPKRYRDYVLYHLSDGKWYEDTFVSKSLCQNKERCSK